MQAAEIDIFVSMFFLVLSQSVREEMFGNKSVCASKAASDVRHSSRGLSSSTGPALVNIRVDAGVCQCKGGRLRW